MALGNLFTVAGYKVDKVEILKYVWIPRFYMQSRKVFGLKMFHLLNAI